MERRIENDYSPDRINRDMMNTLLNSARNMTRLSNKNNSAREIRPNTGAVRSRLYLK